MELKAASRDWQLLNALAAWAVVSIVLGIGLSTAYPDQVANTADSIREIPPFWLLMRLLVGLGAVAAIWLWCRMAGHYLRQRPAQHHATWGAAIFVGLIIGALFYFWLVWRPASNPALHAHAT
jgi:uncharacterized membrane protein YbhN (UPF0104 family)